MVGGLVSTETVLLTIARFPALSVARKLSGYTPSNISNALDSHAPPLQTVTPGEANPDVTSEPDATTFTLDVYQPLDPNVPNIEGVITGGVESILTDTPV